MGRMLFHPDDAGSDTIKRALSVFVRDGDNYKIVEKNPSRFRLCVCFLTNGSSFRVAAANMEATKEETGIERLGGCTDVVVARYARIVCAVTLQRLSRRLSSVWTFSLAIDSATHQGKSYADVRVRFYTVGVLHNFHLLAISLHDRHTALNIYTVIEQMLDVLVPTWCSRLLGVATDGAATMVGKIGGLATLLENQAAHPIVRVWCGLHQLDLKMQVIFESALNKSYLSTLTTLIGHLRRQQTLISEMGSKCPKVATTRWLSMFQVADWLCRHSFDLRKYFNGRKHDCEPNTVWWIFLYAIRDIATEANAVFVSLQGLTALVNQQRDRSAGLALRLQKMTDVKGPLSADALEQLNTDTHEVNANFAISRCDAEQYMKKKLDMYVTQNLETLSRVQGHATRV